MSAWLSGRSTWLNGSAWLDGSAWLNESALLAVRDGKIEVSESHIVRACKRASKTEGVNSIVAVTDDFD